MEKIINAKGALKMVSLKREVLFKEQKLRSNLIYSRLAQMPLQAAQMNRPRKDLSNGIWKSKKLQRMKEVWPIKVFLA